MRLCETCAPVGAPSCEASGEHPLLAVLPRFAQGHPVSGRQELHALEGESRPSVTALQESRTATKSWAGSRPSSACSRRAFNGRGKRPTVARAADAQRQTRRATEKWPPLPAPLGLPSPAKPAPELLGEVLLEAGRSREARQSFEQALGRNPNRSLSVLGLARAAAALGDGTTARRQYEQLLANYDRADEDLQALVEARTNLEQGHAPAPAPTRRAIPIAFAMSTLFAITVLWNSLEIKVWLLGSVTKRGEIVGVLCETLPERGVHQIGNRLLNLYCLHPDRSMEVGIEVEGCPLGQAHMARLAL